jgi:hypothetical protein
MSREDKIEDVRSEVELLRTLIDNVFIQGVTGGRDPVLYAAAEALHDRLRRLEQLKRTRKQPTQAAL